MKQNHVTVPRVLILLMIIVISGCGRRSIGLKYYVIEPIDHSSAVPVARGTLVDAICEIKQVDIFPAFSSNRIAHRNESHEITYYGFHQWAVSPHIEMTLILENSLKHQHIFRDVSTRFWKLTPEFILETTVYQLETIQNKKSLSAHLNIDFRLVKSGTNELVLSHSADRMEPLKQNEMNLFAAAISTMFHDEIRNLTLKIKEKLALQ